jgi:glycosyltransferase involved in cell wall biosynthesis
VRRELGIPSSTPMVLSAARLFRAKGLVELVRATARARREVPELRLVVVGEDYPPGNGHGRELRRLAGELGIGDEVLFCGYRKDMASLMAACDIFALPSFDEPFGLVYAEAMAMKRPVVALDAGGAPEVVEHDRSGLLARPGDVEDLTRHLVTLLRDRPLRNRMGEHGRRVVETRFTPERMARDAAQVYASLDAPGGGRR